MKIVFATNNKHKLKEIRQMAGDAFHILSLEEVGIREEIPEDHETLEENALAKARFVHSRTGLPVFADDTGLEVEALGGRPGVFSARYAGPEKDSKKNIQKLLSELNNIHNRKARFRTVIAFIPPENKEILFEGIVEGTISPKPAGKEGFGYDPVFVPAGYTKTFAELPSSIKNKISHRYHAFARFTRFLDEQFTTLK